MRRWSFVGVWLVAASFGSIAHAEDDARTRASARFREAQSAFALGSYRASALAFEEASTLAPHPSVWLNAAEAWELAGDPLRAAEDCERALAMDDVGADVAAEAKKRLARLATKLARLEVTGAPGLQLSLDEAVAVRPPLSRWVTPGTHRLVVVEGDARREMKVEVDAGARRTIELATSPATNTPSPTPPPEDRLPPAPSRDVSPPAAAWVSFGVAGAAFIGMAAFGGLTLSAKDDFDGAPTRDNADAFYRNRTVTNVALGIGLGAATLGGIIWVADVASGEETAIALRTSGAEAWLDVRRAW